MYSNDILTTAFAAKNININESSGECCNINNSYLWISAFWHWWASTKDKHKKQMEKKPQTSYYLLFISLLCSFFIACLKASNTLHGYWETRKSHQGGNNWLEKPNSPLCSRKIRRQQYQKEISYS